MTGQTVQNKLYTVLLDSDSSIRCPEPFSVEFEDHEGRTGSLTCGNWEDGAEGEAPAHRGLLIQVQIASQDIPSALNAATNVAEAVLTALTLQTLGSTGQSRAQIAYDVTAEVVEREYWQTFEPDVHGRPVKLAKTGVAMGLLNDLQRIAKKSWRDRVIRAGMSLRRGLDTPDDLSRFSEYWMGLECLNPILQELLPTEAAYWDCDCGKRYTKEEARGVKAFLTRLLGSKAVSDIRKLRRDIFHGLNALPALQDRAKVMAQALEPALQKGILLCLGATWESIESLNILALHGFTRPQLRVRATLVGEDPGQLGLSGAHPHYLLRTEVVGRRKEGDITYETMKHVLSPRLGCGSRVQALEFVTPVGWTISPIDAGFTSAEGERSEVAFSVDDGMETENAGDSHG